MENGGWNRKWEDGTENGRKEQKRTRWARKCSMFQRLVEAVVLIKMADSFQTVNIFLNYILGYV